MATIEPPREGPTESRERLLTDMERERTRLLDAAPGSPEWDAARAALDDLEWQMTTLDEPDPADETI